MAVFSPVITLYRLDADSPKDGDAFDISELSTIDDRIAFNGAIDTPKKTSVQNAHCMSIERNPTKGIGDNQGATQDQGDLQPLGTVEVAYVLECIIWERGRADGNDYLQRIRNWETGAQRSDEWPEGVFGLQDTGKPTNDVVPSAGSAAIGLMIEFIHERSDFRKNAELLTIKMRQSKGDGN